MIATALALLALALFAVIIFLSYKQRGQAQIWIGSMALFSILMSFVGLILGLMSFQGENNYKLFSQLGSFCNVFVLVLWAIRRKDPCMQCGISAQHKGHCCLLR